MFRRCLTAQCCKPNSTNVSLLVSSAAEQSDLPCAAFCCLYNFSAVQQGGCAGCQRTLPQMHKLGSAGCPAESQPVASGRRCAATASRQATQVCSWGAGRGPSGRGPGLGSTLSLPTREPATATSWRRTLSRRSCTVWDKPDTERDRQTVSAGQLSCCKHASSLCRLRT